MFHDEPSGLPATPLTPVSLPEVEGPRWRLSDVLVGVLLLSLGFAATVALGVAVVVWGRGAREDAGVALLFTVATLLVEVWAGVIVLMLARRRGISLRDLGFRAPANQDHWLYVPLAVLGAYASIIAYGLTVMLIERVTGADLAGFRQGNPIPDDLPRTPIIWAVLGLAVVVAAPLGEELFFRALVYRGIAGRFGAVAGIVVSGLAFTAVHFNLSVVVPFALIGMIFAWVYRASGSLWVTISAHAIVNGVSFAATVYGVGS